jgi:hypothetical protein
MPKTNLGSGDLTVTTTAESNEDKGVRVRIMIPLRESDASGVDVDQVEYLSISNEQGDNFIRIKRGEWVDVTPETFMLLKQRYPNI